MKREQTEHWLEAPGTDGLYKVSDMGRVARVKTRSGTPCFKIVKPVHGSIVYPTVHFSIGGKRKRATIHRLVALAFVPNPDGLPQVNHMDENPRNNRADNLEWCTELYNHNYGSYQERHMKMRENPIILHGVHYRSIHDCARKTGHDRSYVRRHCERISA